MGRHGGLERSQSKATRAARSSVPSREQSAEAHPTRSRRQTLASVSAAIFKSKPHERPGAYGEVADRVRFDKSIKRV